MKKKKLNSLSLNKKSISNLHTNMTIKGGFNVTKGGICPVQSERGNCLTQIDCPIETHDCATLDWQNDPVCFSFRACL